MYQWFGSSKKSLLISGIISSVSCAPVFAQQSSPDIEEVVVTGSYLRGSPLDAPSPVQVIDRTSIEAQGAAQVWDVIKNLEINSGSISNEGTGDGNLGSLSGTANVNLRNLGENSTLTLINGKRQVAAATTTRSGGEFVDINTIPMVMVDRVEVLTDGGSALYGSDAVAGVVNVIMRTNFEGLEIYGDVQGIEKAGDLFDKTASVIWGWGSDSGNTSFVLAGERFERDPVPVEYARYFDENSEFTGTVGAMGTPASSLGFGSRLNNAYINQSVINKNIAEGGTNTPVYTDPLCFDQNSADGTPFFIGTRTSQRGQNSGSCREYTYDWSYMTVGMERDSLAGSFNHSFSEKAEFYSFFQWSDTAIERSDSGAHAARGPSTFLAAPGAHQGNPAWGGYSIGQTAELGYFAPAAGLPRPTSIPNAPIALANGGINVPMYSPIQYGNTPRQGGNSNMTESETIGAQAGLKGEFTAVDRRFNYDVSYSWSGTSFEQNYNTLNRERAELAANGLGGANCTPNGRSDFDFVKARGHVSPAIPTFWDYYGSSFTQTFFPGFVFNTRESLSLALTSNNQGQGGCQFYNPFLTSMTNPDLANSAELMEWMNEDVKRADKRNKLGVIDAVLSGELIDLPGGMAQFAVGAQYRMQNNKSRAPEISFPGIPNAILSYSNGVPDKRHYVSNNFECSMCIFNYENERNVKAIFGELSLPIINNVETQLAVRWEDYGGNIGSEVTPKVAISWRAADALLVRGSFSQSFRAPNVAIVEEGLEASSNTFRDPIRNQAVRAGLLPPTNEFAQPNSTYTLGGPAPFVGNERADTYNAGFIWTPAGILDGFSFNADFWRFELTDKVLPQPGISAIAHEIAAFEVAAANPANYILNTSIAGNAPVPFEACNPSAIEAQYGRDSAQRLNCVVDPRTYVVDGVVRSSGNIDAALITTVLTTINAGSIIADGFDAKMSYRWDTDYGRFGLGMDFTHVRQYKLIDVPGLELGLLETGKFDAAGTTGDGNLVRSLPDNKGNISFNWSQNNHSVTVITRLIGSYEDLAYQNTFENGNDLVRALARKKIDSYQSWDLQYNYAHQWANANWGSAIFTVGALDAFNADLPYREGGASNYDAVVFDGRGRRLYARALLQL